MHNLRNILTPGWFLVGIAIGAAVWAGAARPVHRAQEPAQPTDAILATLAAQAEAWNRGDLEAFMQTYWKSDELTFSAGGRTTRGWQATLDRYRQRYSTPAAMGKLEFRELEVTMLGDEAALVLGEWRLQVGTESPAGNFSLVLRRIDNQWLIIHDHTSVLEPQS
jgi:beta-aspartyl-peptidase (threonine type)